MQSRTVSLCRLLVGLLTVPAAVVLAKPVDFNLPAQPVAEALLSFSRQARVELLYSYDDLRTVQANAVIGRYEPMDALNHLLKGTPCVARRNLQGKFVVTLLTRTTGSLAGRMINASGEPVSGVTVALADTRLRITTDDNGDFEFPVVPPGKYRLFAGGTGYQPLEQPGVRVEAGQSHRLDPLRLQAANEITELEPYLVKDQEDRLLIGEGVGAAPRRAAGNLDLPRTEDNALPFTIFTREQIARSGVVQLNEFFQRELLEATTARPPEQDGTQPSFRAGSSNLRMRGYESDETVILVNGRRLPETITEVPGQLGAPDVNLIPLSLVQQIEVLPTSASALYSGNAVGGVINIVLRPEADGTEIRTTYTGALGGFDAPQSSVSFQHGHTFLGGKLRLRLNASFTQTTPAVESELGYQQARLATTAGGLLPRATPNIQSTDGSPLFGPGSSDHTSVAPGADGTAGLSAFIPRQGMYDNNLYDTPGGLAASLNSRDYPYGRQQKRASYFGSAVYDVFPWLELGLDATYSQNVVHRGFDVFTGHLTLPAIAPTNPFHQEVDIVLNEIAPQLGQDYGEARLESYSMVAGALLKLPGAWRVAFDAQYARNVARYRGLVRADADRWQQLVDRGKYQPLRDTQVHGPPAEFYNHVLVYHGGPGQFVTLGDYDTTQGTVRVTNEALRLPTGPGTLNVGVDYRRNHLAPYRQEPRFADGTPAAEIIAWSGRTLERISVFGELQAALIPANRLPQSIKRIETDLAARYIVSAQTNETSFAPTLGLKVDLASGLSIRGSYTTSNRFPTPIMSRPLGVDSGSGSGADTVLVFDPLRNEQYEMESRIAINPNLRPEAAVTQTAGMVWQRGRSHRFRASVDFADTHKTNEFMPLDAPALLNLESLFPDRVSRTIPVASGPMRVNYVLTGAVNAARRHSQNWNFALEYARRNFLGGTLELRGRWVWFQRYDRQVFANSPLVDELGDPDGTAPGLLRHRLSFSSGWSGPTYGFGVEGHYLGTRTLPVLEWPGQGSDNIKSYWQIDAYVQTDVTRWLPRKFEKNRLNAQLRVNNLSGFDFPKYAYDSSGTGVQPYGDWRGRTYSFSLTASF